MDLVYLAFALERESQTWIVLGYARANGRVQRQRSWVRKQQL